MDALRIRGGAPLRGELSIAGSKNASLPILTAALLAEGESVLLGAPDLADVRTLCKLLETIGAKCERHNGDIHLHVSAGQPLHLEAPYDLVRTMRASFLVLGPLLARFGRARVSLPGGCAIGARPVDQHLKGLERLGATLTIEHGYVEATAKAGLTGAEIVLDMPSVGATEHLMLTATLARGRTTLRNVAREPEIVDLATVLNAMGARIEGAGTQRIDIEGAGGSDGAVALRPFRHRVIPDRIELGTFLVAGALAGDPLVLTDCIPEHQAALLDKLRAIGAEPEVGEDRVQVSRVRAARGINVKTAPYPGFATDMQAQLMVLLSLSGGSSVVTETIFENRFMHVAELGRLGASIRVEGGQAFIRGVEHLSGSTVMATDLRASACLVLAGLVADGVTVVRRIYHLDRGYERIGRRLRTVGADIERFSE